MIHLFRWSAPTTVPGLGTPDRYRVADVNPLRAWLAERGYGDAIVSRVNERVRVDLPRARQPERGERLIQIAHLLRGAGLAVTEHRVFHVVGLWIDDAYPYGARLPVES